MGLKGRFLDDPRPFLAERVRIAYAEPWEPGALADRVEAGGLPEFMRTRELMDRYGGTLRWEENGRTSLLRVQVTFSAGIPGARAQLHLSVSRPEAFDVRRAPRAARDRLKAILFEGAPPAEIYETPGPMSPAVAHTVWIGAPETLPEWAEEVRYERTGSPG